MYSVFISLRCVYKYHFKGTKIKQKNGKKKKSNKLMLLRSQTLPFLLFETSAAFYHCSFSLLRLMLTLWLCSFLDFLKASCVIWWRTVSALVTQLLPAGLWKPAGLSECFFPSSCLD